MTEQDLKKAYQKYRNRIIQPMADDGIHLYVKYAVVDHMLQKGMVTGRIEDAFYGRGLEVKVPYYNVPLSEAFVKRIIFSRNPQEAFRQELYAQHESGVNQMLLSVKEDIWDEVKLSAVPWPFCREPLMIDILLAVNLRHKDWVYIDQIMDSVKVMLPEEDYLNELHSVDLCVSVPEGDEFTANGYPVPDDSPLVWLAGTQGYTKDQLADALRGKPTTSVFLRSLNAESGSCPVYKHRALVFSVQATLQALIDWASLHNSKDRCDTLQCHKGWLVPQGAVYGLSDKPRYHNGWQVPQGAACGLLDPLTGIQGNFGIVLEKPLCIPWDYARVVADAKTKRRGSGYSRKAAPGLWARTGPVEFAK